MRVLDLCISATGVLGYGGAVKSLGRIGEIGATQVRIHVGGWTQVFDGAVYSVLVRRPDKSTWPLLTDAVPVDGKLTVTVPPELVSAVGGVLFEVRAERNGALIKSGSLAVPVEGALTAGPPPAGVGQNWTDQLTGLVARLDVGIPNVYISGDYLTGWGGKEDERLARLSYRSAKLGFDCAVKMKPQGTSSLSYPKKNFTLNLFEDDTFAKKKKVAMRPGWGGQSKYVLKANWVDPTHACNIVSAQLAAGMQKEYGLFPNAPNRGLIDGYPVLLHMNGECVGLYTWNIPKDGWQFGFTGDIENTALIMCAESQTGSCTFRESASFADWTVEYGKEDAAALAAFNRMVHFIKDASDADFRTHFTEYLNLDACLNYYCFVYLSAAIDNLGKNMLMVSADRQVWSPSLYDLDSLWGVYWDGIELLPYNRKCPEEYACSTSLLWEKLLRCFPDEIALRYEQLRSRALSTGSILATFERFMGNIPQRLYSEDVQIWPEIANMSRKMTQIRAYVPARTQYADYMMRNLRTSSAGNPGRVLYNLPAPFVGNGTDAYVDTGIRLFDNPKRDWTLLVRFHNTVTSQEKVLVSCFSEMFPNYEGLLIRRDSSSVENQVAVVVGSNWGQQTPSSPTEYSTVAVIKNRDSYRVFRDGVLAYDVQNIPLAVPYMGNLLIGCQDDGSYNKIRHSAVTVTHLKVYQKALSDADALALLNEFAV